MISIYRQKLVELFEMAWSKGYARGVLHQPLEEDRDILEVLKALTLEIERHERASR